MYQNPEKIHGIVRNQLPFLMMIGELMQNETIIDFKKEEDKKTKKTTKMNYSIIIIMKILLMTMMIMRQYIRIIGI